MSILHHSQEIIISQNLTRLHDHDHAHLRDYLSIRRLILHVCGSKNQDETLHCRSVLVGKVGHLHRVLYVSSAVLMISSKTVITWYARFQTTV